MNVLQAVQNVTLMLPEISWEIYSMKQIYIYTWIYLNVARPILLEIVAVDCHTTWTLEIFFSSKSYSSLQQLREGYETSLSLLLLINVFIWVEFLVGLRGAFEGNWFVWFYQLISHNQNNTLFFKTNFKLSLESIFSVPCDDTYEKSNFYSNTICAITCCQDYYLILPELFSMKIE